FLPSRSFSDLGEIKYSHLLLSVTKFFLYFSVFVPGICTSSISVANFFSGVPCHVCKLIVLLGFGIHKGNRLLDTQYLARVIKNNHFTENLFAYSTLYCATESKFCLSTLQYNFK